VHVVQPSVHFFANNQETGPVAFIGPGGIGKTHLAQAYDRACCLAGYKTYYLKAEELACRLRRAAASGDPARAIGALVKPSCLIVDEVGRCTFDRECTNLLFHVIDRRYEKKGPNTLILTSNTPVNNWDRFFEGDGYTRVCALDRVFDRASVFVIDGPSYRGAGCETFSVEAKAAVARTAR
jgi:DNA replication protein DnaC